MCLRHIFTEYSTSLRLSLSSSPFSFSSLQRNAERSFFFLLDKNYFLIPGGKIKIKTILEENDSFRSRYSYSYYYKIVKIISEHVTRSSIPEIYKTVFISYLYIYIFLRKSATPFPPSSNSPPFSRISPVNTHTKP